MRNLTAPLLIVLFLTLFAASCGWMGKKEKSTPPTDKVSTLGDPGVQGREIPGLIRVKGVFAPTQRVQIKSEFAGRIEEVPAFEGQFIANGDPLVKFEEGELPTVLERQRAELKEAEEQQALNTRLAAAQPQEELPEEEEQEEEVQAETAFRVTAEAEPSPRWVPPSGHWRPVPGRPEDAGGVWPEMRVERDYAAMSHDPQDAGGIWPDYGPRRRVMGDEDFTVVEPEYEPNRINTPPTVNRTLARRPFGTRTLAPQENVLFRARRLSPTQNPEVTESLLSLDQAKVDRIQAEITVTEKQLARRTLSSPVDGWVERVVVNEDSQVSPDELLVEIFRVDPILLILKVPKDYLDKLERGLEVTVSLADQPGQLFKGEISYIGYELDAEKKSVEVRVRVPNPDFKIKVGMEGTAEIALLQK